MTQDVQITDLDAALRDMITLSEQINALYERETVALKAQDMKTFVGLQEEKHQLATQYQAGSAGLIAHKDQLKDADPTLRDTLKKLRIEFTRIGDENVEILGLLQKNLGRLSGRILSLARDATRKAQVRGYNAAGAQTHAQRSIAVSVRKEI